MHAWFGTRQVCLSKIWQVRNKVMTFKWFLLCQGLLPLGFFFGSKLKFVVVSTFIIKTQRRYSADGQMIRNYTSEMEINFTTPVEYLHGLTEVKSCMRHELWSLISNVHLECHSKLLKIVLGLMIIKGNLWTMN